MQKLSTLIIMINCARNCLISHKSPKAGIELLKWQEGYILVLLETEPRGWEEQLQNGLDIQHTNSFLFFNGKFISSVKEVMDVSYFFVFCSRQ